MSRIITSIIKGAGEGSGRVGTTADVIVFGFSCLLTALGCIDSPVTIGSLIVSGINWLINHDKWEREKQIERENADFWEAFDNFKLEAELGSSEPFIYVDGYPS